MPQQPTDASSHRLHEELLIKLKHDPRIFDFIEKSSLDGLWYWDLEHPEHEWMSESFWATLGYDPATKKHLASEWQDIINQDDLKVAIENFQRHCENPSHAYDQLVRYRHKDGHTVWIRCRGMAIRDEHGNPIRMLGAHTDVTALKQNERQQVEYEQQQKRVFEKQADLLNELEKTADIGTWEFDVRTQDIKWSEQTKRIHEVSLDYEPSLDSGIEFYKEGASRRAITEAVTRGIEHGEPWDVELELITAKGRAIWVRALGKPDFVDGQCVRLFGVFQDITNTKLLKSQLAKQHELMRVTLKSIGDAVITTDAYGLVTWMNPIAQQMTGWMVDEAMGRQLSDVFNIVNEKTRITVENPVDSCLREKRIMGLANHTLLISREGTEYGIADSAAPIISEDGQMMGAVMVFHDVTEQRRIGDEMSYRATHDPLTGLFNRTEFEVRINRLVSDSTAESGLHGVLFVDLDQFKIVNDTCGHSAGDELLQQISYLLTQHIRASDFIARLGGDEFAIILVGCDEKKATNIAKSLCHAVDEYRYIHDGKSFRIGASIGLVPVKGQWQSTTELMQAADRACYAAKDAGRNRVHVWRESDQDIQQRHTEMGWATRIEYAIDNNQFVLFAQRIVPVRSSDKKLCMEVLLRLPDGKSGWVSPGTFLPVAERYYLASRIDIHVVERVIVTLENHANLSSISQVHVNLSGQSVGDRKFHKKLLELLRQTNADILKRLCFEITETVAIRSIADAASFVDSLRSIGIKISLDDFGAGSSSFGYLKNLDVEQLKIDGQFVRDILTDPMDEVAVKAFVEIAKLRQLDTVAEFVDSAEVLNRVTELGVDYAQGYYLHKPEPIENVLAITTIESKKAHIPLFSGDSA